MSLKERQRQGEGAGAGKYPEKIGKYLRGSALAVTSLVVASSFAPQEAHALNPLHYTEDSGKAFEVQLSQRYTGDHKMHKLEYTMQAATAAKSTLRSATMLRGLTDKGESVEGGLAFDGPSGRFYFDYTVKDKNGNIVSSPTMEKGRPKYVTDGKLFDVSKDSTAGSGAPSLKGLDVRPILDIRPGDFVQEKLDFTKVGQVTITLKDEEASNNHSAPGYKPDGTVAEISVTLPVAGSTFVSKEKQVKVTGGDVEAYFTGVTEITVQTGDFIKADFSMKLDTSLDGTDPANRGPGRKFGIDLYKSVSSMDLNSIGPSGHPAKQIEGTRITLVEAP